jgi:hypothetical protein
MTGHFARALFALTIGLALAGCGQGGSPMATVPEEAPVAGFGDEYDERRRAQWEECLGREIERLDDRASGAGTIARAAIELCRAQAPSRPADSRGRPLPESARRDIERATVVVLEKRAAQRSDRPIRRP